MSTTSEEALDFIQLAFPGKEIFPPSPEATTYPEKYTFRIPVADDEEAARIIAALMDTYKRHGIIANSPLHKPSQIGMTVRIHEDLARLNKFKHAMSDPEFMEAVRPSYGLDDVSIEPSETPEKGNNR